MVPTFRIDPRMTIHRSGRRGRRTQASRRVVISVRRTAARPGRVFCDLRQFLPDTGISELTHDSMRPCAAPADVPRQKSERDDYHKHYSRPGVAIRKEKRMHDRDIITWHRMCGRFRQMSTSYTTFDPHPGDWDASRWKETTFADFMTGRLADLRSADR